MRATTPVKALKLTSEKERHDKRVEKFAPVDCKMSVALDLRIPIIIAVQPIVYDALADARRINLRDIHAKNTRQETCSSDSVL